MSRAPSVATQLRTVKRQLREVMKQRDRASLHAQAYRERATKAEQEAAEWRKRFDALLLRVPEVQR